MTGMNLWTGALSLGVSVFLFGTGYRLVQGGHVGRRALLRALAMMLLYWAVFLPRLFWLRRMGLCDLGRTRILRELLTLGSSVVPFAGWVGCYVLGVLLLALLSRARRPHPGFTVFLDLILPVTLAQVIEYYTPSLPRVQIAMQHLLSGVALLGMGSVCARTGLFTWLDCVIGKRVHFRAVWLLPVLLAAALHALLPDGTVGALQLVGGRVSFTFSRDILCAPLLCWGAMHLLGHRAAAPQVQEERLPDAQERGMCREISEALKGAALILMFVHHFFTFPEWYIGEGAYPASAEFASLFRLPLAMCVPVFAFLTGYFYALRPKDKRTMAYSLKKIGALLRGYAPVLLVLFALSALCGARVTAMDFLFELVGLRSEVALFNWYICFYILAMLALPLLSRIPQGNLLSGFLVMIALPVCAATAVRGLWPGTLAAVAAQDVLDGCCSLGAGVLTASFSLWTRGLDVVLGRGKRPRAAYLCACAALLALAFFGRHFAPRFIVSLPFGGEAGQLRLSMDLLYAPVFVYALAALLEALPARMAVRVLAYIGRRSMQLWLLSCAFFGASKALCQPLLYAPGNPVLILLWGLELCDLAARGIDALLRAAKKICAIPLQKGKNRV